MAKTESTNPATTRQSPELATALLKLELLKIEEKEWRSEACRSEHLKQEAAADFAEFMRPFYSALNSACVYLHASDDELKALFGTTRFDRALWESPEVVLDIEGWFPKDSKDLSEEQKYDIGRLVTYGFVAGMTFSGMTGVTLPLIEPVTVTGSEEQDGEVAIA